MAIIGQRKQNKILILNNWMMPGFCGGKVLGEEEFGRKSFVYVNYKMPTY